MTLAAVLLAAGSSRRFGDQNKLLSELNGRPLVAHAAQTLRVFNPDILIAVTRSPEVSKHLTAFEITNPQQADPQQADSLRAGVELARQRGASRILIALADMPFVSVDLLQQVAERCTDAHPSAATDGQIILPPVCFPQSYFTKLSALEGDKGAASLLRDLPNSSLVMTSAEIVQDIDTPERLREAQSG